ncbi:innexin inx2-like [Anopheles bellator]|uniref:innexin inx2-like n=1 Tax=Anopheles bellator TaxID=139047 RepID=UPI00264786C2|nr:innexin inx2-like [Anopheles bellator]
MMELAGALRGMLQVKPVNSTDFVWRLHSRGTVFLLLIASLLLSMRQYFGSPIDCVTGPGDLSASTMNEFCWIMGTYISKDPNFVLEGTDLVKIGAKLGHIPEHERSYQKYYQWVVFILAFQACLFSVPNILWKIWEGRRLESLCEGLTTPIVPDKVRISNKKKLTRYFARECDHSFRKYVQRYCFCMVLNFVNVLLCILFMNMIFSGFWMNYSPAVTALLSFDLPSWNHYNSQMFPKLAKCDFHFVGPSGSKQNRDALCLLALNVVNEKIFAFLWVWFILLAIVSIINLVYWGLLLCSGGMRERLLYSTVQPIHMPHVRRALHGQGIGKWYLLYQVCCNLNPLMGREIIIAVAKMNTRDDPEHTYQKPKVSEADFFPDDLDDIDEDLDV